MKLGDYVLIKGAFTDRSKGRSDRTVTTVFQGILQDIGEDLDGKYIVISNGGKIRFHEIESYLIMNFTEFQGKL